ncbi:MAG: chorismate mutase, partial [Planctomycetota bacterium]
TPDLDADFPARAARQMGWASVPLLCAQEIAVPGAPPRIVRVLLLVNTDLAQEDVRHVYLGEAKKLRPDLVQ